MGEKPWPLDAERELWADICTPGRNEHSLWWFVLIAAGWHWRCTEPGQLDWLTRRVHQPWLDWMQERILAWKNERRAGIKRRHQLIVVVPRGFGKSNVITKCASLWTHLDEPNMTTTIGSETHPKAKDFLKAMRAMMEGSDPYSWFPWLYGVWYSPERDWNNEKCETAYRTSTGVSDASFATFGVETGITSKHPLQVFYDDPLSKEKLKDGGTWLRAVLDSFDAIYPALRTDSMFVLVATRYLDDDPIGTMLSSEGVASWTGHDPVEKYEMHGGVWHVYHLQARDIRDTEEFPKGRPILPEAGWDDDNLSRYEKRNSSEYNAQMMNNPSQGEHMELTRLQIDQMDIERDQVPAIEYATIHLDTAFKDEERRARGDYNAIVVWLHDIRPNGIVYFDRALRSKTWRSEEFDSALLRVMFDLKARGIRIRAITDESEMGGKRGVYKQHLEQVIGGAGLRIPEILQFNRSGTRKVIRLREAAGYWVDGFVRLIKDADNIEVLKGEMLKIGFTKYDDVSDAAADVFRPEIWRGRQNFEVDPQPGMPYQPGDEILKHNAWLRDVENLRRDLAGEDLDDEQPYRESGEGMRRSYESFRY